MTMNQITRKTFLRGLGVSMALPWMESRPVWGHQAAGETVSSQAPTRLAILFPVAAITGMNGGPKAVVPTWNSAGYCSR